MLSRSLQAVSFLAEDKYRSVCYSSKIVWYCIITNSTISITLQDMHIKVEVAL